ncbi:MAG: mechanosensitive ion channel family protein [Haloarculaceae archaeon]
MALPPALAQLLARLDRIVVPAVVFVLATAAVYLPARYLLLPAVRRGLEALDVDPSVELPALKVLHALLAVFALFTAATVSGLASFLAATAAITAGLTIAIGFASRDVLSNLVSGVFIVLDPTFDIGDWIRWGDQEGIIEDISFRTTRVHTFDNELISVPNSQLTTNAVVNPVAKDRRRLSITFELDVECEFARARDVLLSAATDHPDVLARPAPSVRVDLVQETSIVLIARFWIARPERADVVRIRSEFVRTAAERLQAAGIDFPSQELSGGLDVRPVGDGEVAPVDVPDRE